MLYNTWLDFDFNNLKKTDDWVGCFAISLVNTPLDVFLMFLQEFVEQLESEMKGLQQNISDASDIQSRSKSGKVS